MPSEPVRDIERYITVAEAARRLGVHPLTVKRRIYDGTVPAFKVGRIFRINERDFPILLDRYEPKGPRK